LFQTVAALATAAPACLDAHGCVVTRLALQSAYKAVKHDGAQPMAQMTDRLLDLPAHMPGGRAEQGGVKQSGAGR
jgi:hypothetical protein